MQGVCPDLIESNYGPVFEILSEDGREQLSRGTAPDRPVRLP